MLERLAPTGSGFPTIFIGDLVLHSRYNPLVEAERYINSLNFRDGVRFFIFLEPGLDYAVHALRKKFPQACILVLHISAFFTRNTIATAATGEVCSSNGVTGSADAVWGPDSAETVQQFLENHIPDTEASSVAVVEWRPSQAAFGEAYLRLLADTAEFIKRVDANKRTVAAFGRRWFMNTLKNIRLLKRVPQYPTLSMPLVICGAGPSLEEVIPLIKERKKNGSVFILAASSSVSALLAADLIPDLILSTDGGNWALLHLYEALRGELCCKRRSFLGEQDRCQGWAGPVFTASLSAALPSQFESLPWLPISDGSLWQNLLLENTALPFAKLPQRGTVTATALDLAFMLTRGPVYIAGMDLANSGLRTHARPYSFDRLLEEQGSRLKPVYSQSFLRASTIAASGSQSIYAQWFARRIETCPDRIFSLGNNNAVFENFRKGSLSESGQNCVPGFSVPEFIERPVSPASMEGAELLLRSLDSPESRDTLVRELGPLLLNGDPRPSAGAIREALIEASSDNKRGSYE
ncbi:conserved hypothetical protein [Treponema primitia ZAS-2]|uniref:6-hydroxymethylpterin diphosphokinase MptE-like domain-containing protein n=1 Tax=Treponema primitia (strain ATCC BAA-887 / DSM 12427 / ZAS-2) TaxID=545694 RepID=F5YH10_TREPZ|nr:6-hydroxymethylpterin diphosphokinase MptE-like protein [Treponema primitia]AEF86956.1 conserved hypothetical protein [Treponema primitia ZAS-2]